MRPGTTNKNAHYTACSFQKLATSFPLQATGQSPLMQRKCAQFVFN